MKTLRSIVVAWSVLAVSLPLAAKTAEKEVESGPTLGEVVPELKVLAVTGEEENKELDYAAHRGDKLTIYAFVNGRQFDRPMARFLKTLDKEVAKLADDEKTKEVAIVVVWLTDDHDRIKEYLPLVQQSIKLEKSSLCLFPGSTDGPNGWGANPDAGLTVAIVKDKKPTHRWGFVSTNETLAAKVTEALRQQSMP